MYYNFILFYLLLGFLYFCTFKSIHEIVEKLYQNATSKNRTSLKKLKESITLRKKIIFALIWPVYEVYLLIKKDEWRYSTFRLFDFKAFERRK